MKLRGVNQKLARMGYVVTESVDGFTARKPEGKSTLTYNSDGNGNVKVVVAVNYKGEKYKAYNLGAASRFCANHLLDREKNRLEKARDFILRHNARAQMLRDRANRVTEREQKKADNAAKVDSSAGVLTPA